MISDLLSNEQILADWPPDRFVAQIVQHPDDIYRAKRLVWDRWIVSPACPALRNAVTWDDFVGGYPEVYIATIKWFVYGEELPK